MTCIGALCLHTTSHAHSGEREYAGRGAECCYSDADNSSAFLAVESLVYTVWHILVGVTRGLYEQPKVQARAVITKDGLVSTDGSESNSDDVCITERVHDAAS